MHGDGIKKMLVQNVCMVYTNSQGVFEKKIINHLHRFYVMWVTKKYENDKLQTNSRPIHSARRSVRFYEYK